MGAGPRWWLVICRKSGSIIYLDREGNEVLRGPLVGGDPSDLIDLGDAAGSAGGKHQSRAETTTSLRAPT